MEGSIHYLGQKSAFKYSKALVPIDPNGHNGIFDETHGPSFVSLVRQGLAPDDSIICGLDRGRGELGEELYNCGDGQGLVGYELGSYSPTSAAMRHMYNVFAQGGATTIAWYRLAGETEQQHENIAAYTRGPFLGRLNRPDVFGDNPDLYDPNVTKEQWKHLLGDGSGE